MKMISKRAEVISQTKLPGIIHILHQAQRIDSRQLFQEPNTLYDISIINESGL
jgi:hypothetical protein